MYTLLLIAVTLATSAFAAPKNLLGPMPHNFLARTKKNLGLTKRAEGGVELCTGIDYTGNCDYVVWPWNECIALNDYAGQTFSFRPDEGTECFLMQGKCNAEEEYASLAHDDKWAGDLSGYPWIHESESYMCFQENPPPPSVTGEVSTSLTSTASPTSATSESTSKAGSSSTTAVEVTATTSPTSAMSAGDSTATSSTTTVVGITATISATASPARV